LVIDSDSDSLPNDSKFLVDDLEVTLNSNGKFIIPFSTALQNKISTAKYITSMFLSNNIGLKIELWMSATMDANNPFAGKLLNQCTINIAPKQLPSIKIIEMDNRVLKQEDLNNEIKVVYDCLNCENYTITLEVQQKTNQGYITINAIKSINNTNLKANNIINISDYNDGILQINFIKTLDFGTYRFLISAIDKNNNQIYLQIKYNFVIING
jgi:hypothetical protein